MKVKQKIILGLIGIALLVGVVGVVSITVSRQYVQDAIGNRAAALAAEIAGGIDRSIYTRIEEFRTYATDSVLRERLRESNREFAALSDPDGYLRQRDEAWTAAPPDTITPFMREIIDNRLSEELRDKTGFHAERQGYRVYGEVLVTNRYGANVAQTGKTTDYYQADKAWWQTAARDGFCLQDVAYDESAGVYSVAVGIRVEDDAGQLTGVIKLVLNIDEAINALEEKRRNELSLHAVETATALDCKLLDGDGRVIYATDGYDFLETIPDDMAEFIFRPANQGGYYLAAGDKAGEGEELFAYSRSSGYRDYPGLGWTVVVEYATDELLAPVAQLRTVLMMIFLAAIVLAVAGGIMASRSISRPLARLATAVRAIGHGRLETKVIWESEDEFGDLASSINRMTEELQRVTVSHEYVASIMESMTESLVVVNADGTIRSVNRATLELLGYEEKELLGKPIGMVFAEEEERFRGTGIQNLIKKGAVRNREKVYLAANGAKIPVLFSGSVMRDTQGRVQGIVCIARDITGRIKAEDELRISLEEVAAAQRDWEETFNSINDVITIHDLDYNIVQVNKAAEDMFEKPFAEMRGKKCYSIYHGTGCPPEGCPSCNCVQNGEVVMQELFEPHLQRYIGLKAAPRYDQNGNITGVIHVVRDISARKRAETVLRESEELHRVLFASSHDAIMTLAPPSWKFTAGNAAAIAMFGAADEDDFTSRSLWQYSPEFQPDGRRSDEKARAMIEKAMEEGANFFAWDHQRLAGELFPATVLLTRVDVGAASFLQATVRDITDSKRAEEALRESEGKLGSMLESMSDHMSMMDRDLNILWANEVAKKLFGEDIIGKKCYAVYHRRDKPCEPHPCLTLRAFQDGRVHEHDTQVIDRDGMTRYFHCTANVALRDEEGNPQAVLEISRDITEEKELQAQLIQTEKLASIGTMLSGLAHELNNPLAAVVGFAQLLEDAPLDEQSRKDVGEIIANAMRCKKIIDNVLIFSRRGEQVKGPCDINDALRRAYQLKERDIILDDITVELDLSEELPRTLADGNQLEQVFLNLINNAHHALQQAALPRRLALHSHAANGSVVVRVINSGPAIPPAIMKRIFDPFFSTKETGKGTGLGLAISYGIIQEHNGTIAVESDAETGTVFSVTIPIVAAAESAIAPAPPPPPAPPPARLRALVVDDEAAIRAVIRRSMEALGGEAVTCALPSEATARLVADSFDVVFCDIRFPGEMNGFSVHDLVLEQDPARRPAFVFMSGQTSDQGIMAEVERRGARFLAKPFAVDEIKRIIIDLAGDRETGA